MIKTNMPLEIILTDPTVIEYYHLHPELDPNTINIFFINILTQLSTNVTTSLDQSRITQIINKLHDVNHGITNIKEDITDKVKGHIGQLENIILKDRDKISEVLADKTSILLTNTNNQFNQLLTSHDEKHKLQLYQNNNEIKQLLIKNEEQYNNQFVQLKDKLDSQTRNNEGLHTELNQFLNKYKHNSSIKGNVSEKELYYLLQLIFPSDELIVCSKTTASCDICVNRYDKNKPSILFENKDYINSVDKEEIQKFERDLYTQQKHGIFISQNSPITFKTNYHIDIINGLIHVYIPNANYDLDRIKIAVDIIDNLSNKISTESLSNYEIGLSKTELDEIVNEYKMFANKKVRLLDNIKTTSKIWIEELDSMTFPRIQTLLINTGNIEKTELTCSFCMTFTGKNKASLSAHIKGCKMNSTKK
jgi:hypothetical protein